LLDDVTKRSLVFKASLHSKNKYKLVTAQHMNPEKGKHIRIVKYVALKLWSLMEEREIFQNTSNQTNFQKQIGRLQTL
jgi:hypothetical protein